LCAHRDSVNAGDEAVLEFVDGEVSVGCDGEEVTDVKHKRAETSGV
jgi:hypothetical protein